MAFRIVSLKSVVVVFFARFCVVNSIVWRSSVCAMVGHSVFVLFCLFAIL